MSIENKLFKACQSGVLPVVEALVEAGADIHASDDRPLLNAAEYGHLEVVKYLVENGADKLDFALTFAVSYGHLDVVKYLHEQGVDIHLVDDFSQAAYHGHLEVVKYFIEQGASFEDKNEAFRMAIEGGKTGVVEYLKGLS